MALYEVQWKKSAEKDIRAIDARQIPHLVKAVESLSTNPIPTQSRKLRYAERIYRLRVGQYRIVYEVDIDNRTVMIYHVRHRKNAYRRRFIE